MTQTTCDINIQLARQKILTAEQELSDVDKKMLCIAASAMIIGLFGFSRACIGDENTSMACFAITIACILGTLSTSFQIDAKVNQLEQAKSNYKELKKTSFLWNENKNPEENNTHGKSLTRSFSH